MFGSLGKLQSDGVRNQCHICGRWYKGLGSHVVRAHDMTAEEYRTTFEIKVTQSLMGEESSQRLSAAIKRTMNVEQLRRNRIQGRATTRAKVSAGVLPSHRRRLQSKIDPAYQDAQRRAIRLMRKGLEIARESGSLPAPIADHMNTPEIRQKAIQKRWYQNPNTQEGNAKISEALKKYWEGNPTRPTRVFSDDTRRKMSAAAKRRGMNPDTAAKAWKANRERCSQMTAEERRNMFKPKAPSHLLAESRGE